MLQATPAPYPRLEVSRSALKNNLDLLQSLAPGSRVLVAVKANAYGCGLEPVAEFLRGTAVEYLGVANITEAAALRAFGWKREILSLGALFPENIDDAFRHRMIPTITTPADVKTLASRASVNGGSCTVHVKFDLGMGRLGVLPAEFEILRDLIRQHSSLRVSGIYTHFPDAGYDIAGTDRQIADFSAIADRLIRELDLNRSEVLLHTANSYGALFHKKSHFDMIRPGLAFYGYFQTLADFEKNREKISLQPAISIVAEPILRRNLAAGSRISYGSNYTVSGDSETIGVLPLGYADGIPRALSNRINFGGFPLRGNVTMDQIMLGNAAKTGEINLFGADCPPLEAWADLAGTTSYEIMTHFGERLRRLLV